MLSDPGGRAGVGAGMSRGEEEPMADREGALPHPVADEQALLGRVLGHLRSRRARGGDGSYDADLIDLRNQIAEAKPEDVPPLVEQMTRLQALAAQRGAGEEAPLDPGSPYFGHLRLAEDGAERDVLLGKRTHLDPEAGIRIVDWRNAPVSRMYYRYDVGDDYEEEFGGRVRRGEVTARRSVTVTDGRLHRVASSTEGTWVRGRDGWRRLEGDGPSLRGGQGSAVRADALRPVRGTLGVEADGQDRLDRHLPEISALLDREQFEIISCDDSGLLVVEGGAGSGKTTVGLHRVAYLAYRNPRRFQPRKMMVAVPGRGLSAYVSGVLPALGVRGVRVAVFDEWAHRERRRHVPGLPRGYSEWTPSVVTRMKKHPALLRILDDVVDQLDERLTAELERALAATPQAGRVIGAWRTLGRIPLDARRRRMLRWLDGEARVGRDGGEPPDPGTELAAARALERMEGTTADVIATWAELFTDREALGRVFGTHAASEFTDGELDAACAWCARQWARIDEALHEEPGGEGRGDPEPDDREEPVLDTEDNAILLRLHQLQRGWLEGPGGRLELEHLMIDEAQDWSALEMAVLLHAVPEGRPVTLAGDPAQRASLEAGFDDWDELLADLGRDATRVAPLRIAYRSTAEVMELAFEVLGPLAGELPEARRRGAPVEVHRFSDPGQAVDFLGGALRDLAGREPLASVAVIARHPAQAAMYCRGLEQAEVPRLRLVADQDFSFAPGVEVTDVRQVKGLEFDYVVLVEVNADSYPENDEARHLLHVAATRAAHQLWILTTRTPSPLLPGRILEEV
jgi:DNA helicase-2/ATP-dependent DNA helicase PcrA